MLGTVVDRADTTVVGIKIRIANQTHTDDVGTSAPIRFASVEQGGDEGMIRRCLERFAIVGKFNFETQPGARREICA